MKHTMHTAECAVHRAAHGSAVRHRVLRARVRGQMPDDPPRRDPTSLRSPHPRLPAKDTPGRDGQRGCDGRAADRRRRAHRRHPPDGEYWPFARTGGLGEAVSGLAMFQAAAGHPTTVVMPCYQQVARRHRSLERTGSPLTINARRAHRASVAVPRRAPGQAPRRPQVFFIEHPTSSTARRIYGDNGATTRTRPSLRVLVFGALTATSEISETQVLHAHDWQRPWQRCSIAHRARRRAVLQPAGGRAVRATLSTFSPRDGDRPRSSPRLYNVGVFEWYGRMNALKGALAFSDIAVDREPDARAGAVGTPDGGSACTIRHRHATA